MNSNINKNFNDEKSNINSNARGKAIRDYSYYSRVLEKPFDSIEELKIAEEAHYAAIRAKENKAATKKADAKKVEDAFKALNAARKAYKEKLVSLATDYSENLKKLKDSFESEKAVCQAELASAETVYSTALKSFTDKYPEGYHLTLKDGDFETTIESRSSTKDAPSKTGSLLDLFDWVFSI